MNTSSPEAVGMSSDRLASIQAKMQGYVDDKNASGFSTLIARKGKVVGMDFVEVVPELDVSNLTSQFGARMLLNLIGVLAHNGYIGA